MNRKSIRSAVTSFVEPMSADGEALRNCLKELKAEHEQMSQAAYEVRNRPLMAWHMAMIKKINTTLHKVNE